MSVSKLYLHKKPEPTVIGIIIALVSIVVMTVLFHLKQKVGMAIKSKSIIVDSKQTLTMHLLIDSSFYWVRA